MPVQGGKRREYRPVWYGENNTSPVQNYSVGNWLTFAGGPNPNLAAIAIGNNVLLNNSFGNVALGQDITVTGFYSAICVGQQLSVGCASGTCIGHSSTIGSGGGNIITLGDSLTVQNGGGDITCIGSFSEIQTPGSGHISIGPDNRILANSDGNVCVGSNLTTGAFGDNIVLVGYSLSTQGQGGNLVLIGALSRTYTNCSESVCLGNNMNIFNNTNRSVCVGYQSTLAPETGDCVVVGSGSIIYNTSIRSTAIGYDVTIGAATNATFFMIVPDLADLANNDWVSLPDGRGGTIEVEFQVDGSFVPFGPPRLVADVQFAANSTDVGYILVDTWNSVYGLPYTFPIQSESVGGDGRWTGNFIYPSPGVAGNGWSVVPTVASGLFTGSTSLDGTQTASPNCVCIGSLSTINGNCADSVLIGHNSTLTGLNGVAIGADVVLTGNGCVAIGTGASTNEVGGIAIGSGTICHDGGGLAICIGAEATGNNCMAIGPTAQATGIAGIALGDRAVASSYEFVVGDSENISPIKPFIHHFVVRGFDLVAVTPIDTLSVIDNPSVAGETGLTLTYYNGVTVSNKTLKASTLGTLPAGSLVIYVDP